MIFSEFIMLSICWDKWAQARLSKIMSLLQSFKKRDDRFAIIISFLWDWKNKFYSFCPWCREAPWCATRRAL